MNTLAHQFVEFCVKSNALQFGQFQLRSGRHSPYFFNFAAFNSGSSLAQLGQYYADKIVEAEIRFDVLFGPAYKGIPIATAVAISLQQRHGRSVPVCFNRKEAKTHAEQGLIIGAAPRGRVLLVDDVLTSGSAASEVIDYLKSFADVEIAGLLVGLDRQEQSSLRNRQNLHAVAGLDDVIKFLSHCADYGEYLVKMQEYHQKNAQ
ncbi:MAG: orotate phosphoribosyltransferase [Gammaproteobacteria bacterium]|nr:orotate phosphoribosyltransferase [Pseudomonadota bacterium]MCH9663675.1 orotate phosphoribosyltransferase [Gammaproteobacteria bacterium]